MGYYSEQHLLYGARTTPAVPALPGRAERADSDNRRIVISERIGQEPVYRYFTLESEARRAARLLRPRYFVTMQYWHVREERWI